jgi:hypothetical protein
MEPGPRVARYGRGPVRAMSAGREAEMGEVRTSEACARSILGQFKSAGCGAGGALPDHQLESQFLAGGGSGADFIAGKTFALEHLWIRQEGDEMRLTEAGASTL